MKILSIETSCDETGISILEVKGGNKNPRLASRQATFKILADELSSQVKLHAKYGGVFPALAKREHIKNLPILLEKVLVKAKLKSAPLSAVARSGAKKKIKAPVDAICVTSGPGLEPALWTGIVFAKELGKKWRVPVVPVNHMEGHVLSVFGKNEGSFKIPAIKFPALALLVSGGHTELVLMKDFMSPSGRSTVGGKYEVIGETLDDAAGEAFDKVARMMELAYPGGPEISKLAEKLRNENLTSLKPLASFQQEARLSSKIFSKGDRAKFSAADFDKQILISLPRPMMYTKNFDFSFSGLKTAVLYLIRDIGKLDDKIKMQIALEFENAVVETLVHKTKKAVEKYNAKTVIVGGGVASNTHLRNEIKKAFTKQKVLFPGKGLSTDNSIMIGMAGYFKFIKNKTKKYTLKAEGGLRLEK